MAFGNKKKKLALLCFKKASIPLHVSKAKKKSMFSATVPKLQAL